MHLSQQHRHKWNNLVHQNRPKTPPPHSHHRPITPLFQPSSRTSFPKHVIPRHPQLPPHIHNLPLRLPPPQPHLHLRRRLQHHRPGRLPRLPRPPRLLHRKRPPLPRLARHRSPRRRSRPAERKTLPHHHQQQQQEAHGQSTRHFFFCYERRCTTTTTTPGPRQGLERFVVYGLLPGSGGAGGGARREFTERAVGREEVGCAGARSAAAGKSECEAVA